MKKIKLIIGAQGSGKTSKAYQLLNENRKTPKHVFLNTVNDIRNFVNENTEVVIFDLCNTDDVENTRITEICKQNKLKFRKPYNHHITEIPLLELIICTCAPVNEKLIGIMNLPNVEVINL